MAVRRLIAAVIAAFLLSCDSPSPFAPQGTGERVPVNQVIIDELDGDTLHRFSFTAAPDGEYVLFVEALEGTVAILVRDSATQAFVLGMTTSPSGRQLEDNPSVQFFGGANGRTLLIDIRSYPPGASIRFRFEVYKVETAPETRASGFAIGDTIAGESLNPSVDADEFVVHGDADRYWVGVLEALGPSAGGLSLIAVGEHANGIVGSAATLGGGPPSLTGRTWFPTTQDYRFIVRSVISNIHPRYSGPYRFWTYAIDPLPEHRPAAITPGGVVVGESIDRAGDFDEFTLQAPAGAEFNAFLQSDPPFQLEVTRPGGQTIAIVTSAAGDTGLMQHATGTFSTPAAGSYVVRISGMSSHLVADTGAYRFLVYPIDRRPERTSASVAAGDTISGEAIDVPGDIDEFTFSGAAGSEYTAFLQAQSGSAETMLRMGVVDPGGTVLRVAQSTGTDTVLLKQVSGRFTLTSTGTYRLRIAGELSREDRDIGPYRVFLYKVNSAPETVSADLVPGDSISGESIDVPGDFDDFRLVVAESTGLNLVAQLDDQPDDGTPVLVQIFDASGTTVSGIGATIAPTEAGRFKIGPGTYTVRVDVQHWQDKPTFRGSYRFWLYRFAYAPEQIPATFAIGDTVSGEVIAPWGDVDEFRFYGSKGQHINIGLQGQATQLGLGFQLWVYGPGGYLSVSSAASDTGLHDHQSMRLDLVADGWYQVQVMGFGPTQGPYRFLVEPFGTAPETAPAQLVAGDSVMNEALDFPGDWDEFTVTEPAGSDVGIVMRGSVDPPYTRLWVLDPVTGDTLGQTVSQFLRVLGPIRVPAAGQVHVAIFQQGGFFRFCYDATCAGIYNQVGPYNFSIIRINRPPETVAASYTIEDTVRGDAIDPLGDVDEFTSSGTPGERLSPQFRLTGDPVPPGTFYHMEIVDPVTDAILVGDAMAVFRATPDFQSPGSFTVPAFGAFVIRMRSGGYVSRDTDHGTAPYEFVVRRF
jgi:hypothetical protein